MVFRGPEQKPFQTAGFVMELVFAFIAPDPYPRALEKDLGDLFKVPDPAHHETAVAEFFRTGRRNGGGAQLPQEVEKLLPLGCGQVPARVRPAAKHVPLHFHDFSTVVIVPQKARGLKRGARAVAGARAAGRDVI